MAAIRVEWGNERVEGRLHCGSSPKLDRRRSNMESPIEVVRRFCVAWSEDMGADDLAAFFTDDAV